MTQPDHAGLRVSRAGGIVDVLLDRPDAKNAIIPTMWAELRDAFASVDPDAGDRVMVLRGAGADFCAGADVVVPLPPGRDHVWLMDEVRDATLALHDVPVPTIAAVDGVAVGGGCNLAFGCDLVVATERARFSQIFGRRGLVVDTGGSWLLPNLVGLSTAKKLVLLSEVLAAEEVQRLGLLAELVGHSELDTSVAALCDRLLALPTHAAVASKRLLHAAAGGAGLRECLEGESAAQLLMVRDEWFKDQMRSFRKPVAG